MHSEKIILHNDALAWLCSFNRAIQIFNFSSKIKKSQISLDKSICNSFYYLKALVSTMCRCARAAHNSITWTAFPLGCLQRVAMALYSLNLLMVCSMDSRCLDSSVLKNVLLGWPTRRWRLQGVRRGSSLGYPLSASKYEFSGSGKGMPWPIGGTMWSHWPASFWWP